MTNLFFIDKSFLGNDSKLFLASIKNEKDNYSYYFISLDEKNFDLDFYIVRNVLTFLDEFNINLMPVEEKSNMYEMIVSPLREVEKNLTQKKEQILNNKNKFSENVISSRNKDYINYNLLQDEFINEQEYLLSKYLVKVTNMNSKKGKR